MNQNSAWIFLDDRSHLQPNPQPHAMAIAERAALN